MIRTSNGIMLAVTLALMPGAAVLSWFYGSGYLLNLAIALPLAYALDFVCQGLRGRAPLSGRSHRHDGMQTGRDRRGAVIATSRPGTGPESTAAPRPPSSFDVSIVPGTLILVLALPPGMPWHVLAVAAFGMIVLARQLYGGLGHNIFNPAMVGYVLALVCFPATLAVWPPLVDGHTGATALTEFRYRDGLTVAEAFAGNPVFGRFGGHGWEWANLAFACGGLAAGALGLVAWRVVLGFLIVLGVLALVFHDGGSSRSAGSPLFHFFSAGTMLAAFFVVTDPVTHPGHPMGQWLFGAIVAGIAFAIRAWGGYPDGIAFGVLIANAASPFLDALCRGRVRAP